MLSCAASAEAIRPLRLIATPSATGVRLQVVGETATPLTLAYRLEAASGRDGRGNRSQQAGRARLEPGKRVVLATLFLAGHPHEAWSAQLTVQPEGAAAYSLESNAATAAR